MKKISQQLYWRHPSLPFVALRETLNSTHAYKAHSHETLSIGAIISGTAQMTIAGDVQLATQGDLVLIEPDCVHSCNPIDEQGRSYFMLFLDYGWCLDQVKALLGKQNALHFTQAKINQPDLFNLYLAFVADFKNAQYTQAEKTLKMLLIQITQAYASEKLRVAEEALLPQQIKSALSVDLTAPPDLQTLAKAHHIRRETLIRRFKKQTGFSPKAYLNNVRIEKAKQLLENGQSIIETSYELGFADQSHFHKTFIHYTASTPSQYQGKKSLFDKK